MALAALALQGLKKKPRLRYFVIVASTLGVSLFFGDGIITPAISVLSAVEGLQVISHWFGELVLPITLVIMVGLFAIQRRGTRFIGKISAPVMLAWFLTLASLGLWHVAESPSVLIALNPLHALRFAIDFPRMALMGMGAVVLAITGVEAIYADMGHFGPRPIRHAWYGLVYPALVLNYFGQGALLLRDPAMLDNPFFRMVPPAFVLPLVILSTFATIIASQAVITGAFSLSSQAVQIGLLPRLNILHTDAHQRGQVYVPQVNWLLLAGIMLLLMNFHSSSALAGMYGVAVTGTMLMTSLLILIILKRVWRRSWFTTIAVGGTFLIVDLAMFAATVVKVEHGGYITLLIGGAICVMMLTWRSGHEMLRRRRRADSLELPALLKQLRGENEPLRLPGAAVYMAFMADVVPYPLLYALRYNHALHEVVVLLTVRGEEDRPMVPEADRVIVAEEEAGFWHIITRHGFMERPNVRQALFTAMENGLRLDPEQTTFFVGRDRLVLAENPTPDMQVMAKWRKWLFIWLANHSTSATDYYRLPPARVLEVGAQVEL